MAVNSIVVPPAVLVDPNPTPKAGIEGDGQRVVVDPAVIASEAAKPARAAWLPEKFKTPEDMAKAYAELEKKQSEVKPAAEVAKPLTPAEATTLVTDAGLDMAKLTKEFAEQGTLSESSLMALTAKGIDRATVNAFIEGQKAVAAQMTTSLAAIAGGADGLKVVYAWAQTALSAEEIATYNAVVDSGNIAGARLALQGLVARHQVSEGVDPKLVNATGGAPAGTAESFASRAEMTDAIRDKRYAKDPAYRAKVEARIAATDFHKVG